MEIKFNKVDSIKFIEEYYREFEQRNVKASIRSHKGTYGCGISEISACCTTVVIEEEIEIMGIKTKIADIIPEGNLLGIFKAILGEQGFDVTKVEFDDGITTSCEGAYMNEHQTSKIYCKGVIVNVRKKTKQKTIGGK